MDSFQEVVEFLIQNPKELQRVKDRMHDLKLEAERPQNEAAEKARRAKLPMKNCPGLGYGKCSNKTPGGFVCKQCNDEFSSDPDAYK